MTSGRFWLKTGGFYVRTHYGGGFVHSKLCYQMNKRIRVTNNDSYLGKWPLILEEYLWCLLPCLELIMDSVSVQTDSAACGGKRDSPTWDTLSVHCEPPSDWFEPSEDTSCRKDKKVYLWLLPGVKKAYIIKTKYNSALNLVIAQ